MKKLLISFSTLFFISTAKSQIVLFEDNFETYTDFNIQFSPWINLDLDLLDTYVASSPSTWPNAGVPKAFQIFNFSTSGETNSASGAEVRNFDPHSGLKYAACWSGIPTTTVTANEDWLISPPINLGLTGNSLSFWVKSLSNSYGLEKYKVGVYVGSGVPTSSSNFTIISGSNSLTAPYPNWEQKTFSLDTYAGQTVRIGIQCVSSDNYMLMVDTFKVTATTLGTKETDFKRNISISPNPSSDFIIINAKNKIFDFSVYDISGKKVELLMENNKLNIKSLQNGTYILNISTSEGRYSQKFIKK